MKLDLRRPTLVLAGAWNPAIFHPGWIARHVFGVPTGVEITVRIAKLSVDEQPKEVLYVEDVGFSVSQGRLEMFAVEADKSAFNKVENAMKKIVEVLPHTPILACGINFYFFEERPHPDLLQKIKANDGLEAKFEVAQEQIASRIRLESATELNLIHKNDKSSVAFDFNFHRSGMDGDELAKQIDGEIQGRMEQAMDIMKDIYALSTYEVLMHQFASNE